jgi:hypothetical protein
MQQRGVSPPQSNELEHSSCVVQPHCRWAQSSVAPAQHTGVAAVQDFAGPQRNVLVGRIPTSGPASGDVADGVVLAPLSPVSAVKGDPAQPASKTRPMIRAERKHHPL